MFELNATIVKRQKFIRAMMGGFTAALVISCSAVAHEPIGVMGLYKSADQETVLFDERKIAALGCKLKRHGVILGMQGKLDVGQPNLYLLLSCDGSLLTDISKHALFNSIAENTMADVILEGPIIDFPNTIGDGKIVGREYILKVSHYNNTDIDGRSKSLANIDRRTSKLSDKYITESFIGVTHASGMSTPDEVVIIYYDSPEHGDCFRKNNSEVLGLIGEFNNRHVSEFTYLIGDAIK